MVEAGDGEEAVRRFREHQAEIKLALLDVQLPRRSGPEALAVMRAQAPGLPALLVSANPGEGEIDGQEVLQKPVPPEVLLRAVRTALDG